MMEPSKPAAPTRSSIAQPTAATQSAGSLRTASEAGFASSQKPKRQRGKGKRKPPKKRGPTSGVGDDGSSPGRPITNPLRAFIEIMKKATSDESLKFADLKSIAEQGGITFKVATLCSGTESPIFALQLIQQALYSICGLQLFRFEHVLAAEWNPFKQAFASRNSGRAVMFNDVRHLIIGRTKA